MKSIIRYTIFVFGMSLIVSFTSGNDDSSKIYIMALKEHILRIEKSIASQIEKREFDRKPIFIINDCGVELPKELGNHVLQELGDSSNAFIGDNGGLHAIKLNPVSIDRGNIIVILSDYIVTKDNKEAKFSYGGGREYIFNYDSKSQRYAIVRTKAISF